MRLNPPQTPPYDVSSSDRMTTTMECQVPDSPVDLDDSSFRSQSSIPSQGYPSPFSSSSSSVSGLTFLDHPVPQWYFVEDFMHKCPFHIDTCQGCDGTHTEDLIDDQKSQSSGLSSVPDGLMSRRRSTTPASVSSFHSPQATRVQLKEEFLKLYFPAGIDHETDFMYTKFLGRDSLEGMGDAMVAAVDTLSLVQLGTSHSDPGLIHEAQARYNAAVSSVNAELARPEAMYDDGVLGAVYLLGFCEMYQPLSALSAQAEPWRTHHRGLRDMLLARGPSGEYSRFAQLLVYNFRHVAAIVGCTDRKRVKFAGNAWKRCSALTDGLMSALSEHIINVPGVLETADIAMNRPFKIPGELFTVLMRLATLERDTHTWLLHWYSSFATQPYWQVSMESFRHFRRHCIDVPKVFSKALQFPSFSHASAQITHWIGLLQLKHTMMEINELFPRGILPKSTTTLVAEANEIADKLCQSVAWLTQPRHGFCGVLRAVGPLHYAAKWYAKHMDLEKIAWCEKVARSIETESSIACFYHNHHPRHSKRGSTTASTNENAKPSGSSDGQSEDLEFDDVEDSLPP